MTNVFVWNFCLRPRQADLEQVTVGQAPDHRVPLIRLAGLRGLVVQSLVLPIATGLCLAGCTMHDVYKPEDFRGSGSQRITSIDLTDIIGSITIAAVLLLFAISGPVRLGTH